MLKLLLFGDKRFGEVFVTKYRFKEKSFMGRLSKREDYINKVFESKKYGAMKIIEYTNSNNVLVKFLRSGFTTKTKICHVMSDCVRDYEQPYVYGVGILGTEPVVVCGLQHKAYKVWVRMLERCYDEKYLEKFPSYVGCNVSDNFKYFPNFKAWCDKQIGFNNKGWCLDKDIILKGNKTYSEDNCCFVPQEINALFTLSNKIRGEYPIGVWYNNSTGKFVSQLGGKRPRSLGKFSDVTSAFLSYKVAKELYIKQIATTWKESIDERVYNSLMNWQIEITD